MEQCSEIDAESPTPNLSVLSANVAMSPRAYLTTNRRRFPTTVAVAIMPKGKEEIGPQFTLVQRCPVCYNMSVSTITDAYAAAAAKKCGARGPCTYDVCVGRTRG